MAAASLLPPILPSPSRSEMPPILPTPPRSEMLPLLPTPSGVTLLLAVSTMPGRADFVQRWDTYKRYKMTCSPPPSSASSSSSDTARSPCRSDAVERWDVNKKYKVPGSATSSSSSSDGGRSPGGAHSVEPRWDCKKLIGVSLPTDRGRRHDGNTKRPASRVSSAERWDLHKKPRPEGTADKQPSQAGDMTATAPEHKEMTRMQQDAFAGHSFYASPEPSMLPVPSFLMQAH